VKAEGKPTLCIKRKATDLDTQWQVFKSPAAFAVGYGLPSRGLKPDHVFKGGARELGRSGCGLARKGKVSGADSEERTNLRQAFGSLSGS